MSGLDRPWVRVGGLAAVLCSNLAVAPLLGTLGGPRLDRAAGTALIMVTAVVGVKMFVGDSGIFSFGHIAFMGIGAYTTAIVMMAPAQRAFQLRNCLGSWPAWSSRGSRPRSCPAGSRRCSPCW